MISQSYQMAKITVCTDASCRNDRAVAVFEVDARADVRAKYFKVCLPPKAVALPTYEFAVGITGHTQMIV